MDLILALLALSAVVGLRFMLPMVATRLRLGTLLADDTTTLAPAEDANLLGLVTNSFTLVETLTAGDLTIASTNGLAPIACATGDQGVGIDPVSQQQIITIIPGMGTFRWVSSGSFTEPITVYGFALTDSTGATLIAAQTLATPVVFSEAGYQIDLDPVQLVFVLQPLA
jgi:hypothetical protein